ncbi:MAG: threonine-phosphate decarboxylase CobD [Cyanobacteria bacterium P01_A01_bin.105]
MIRPVHGGNLSWAAQLARCAPEALLDFSASICPLGPPPSILAAVQAELPRLVHYPDPDYRALRAALGQHHHLSPDWILPGNGAAELLTWASRDFATIGTCAYLTPAFGDYARSLKSDGVSLQPISLLSDQHWDFERWHQILRSRPPGGLLLNNPHNPTGHLWSQAELARCLAHGQLVVVDEAFMDFLPLDQQPSLVDWVQQYDNLVVLRSLTKFYSIPGLRIGYAVAHPDRLRRWQQWRDPWPVNALAAAAAIAALADADYQAKVWQWLPTARQALFDQLDPLPGLTPLASAANFLLVKSRLSVSRLQQRLLEQHRIYVRDCLSFDSLGDAYFRVAVRTEAENQKLVAALAACLTA